MPVKKAVVLLQDVPSFASIQETADQVMDGFARGEYASVKVVYTRYFSAGRQKAVVEDLLPLHVAAAEGAASVAEPLFIPDKQALISNLVPRAVRMTLFRFFLDAAASEQLARQMAMSSASDNALDMVKHLTLSYNRARQAQITTEISEIVGGAEALN